MKKLILLLVSCYSLAFPQSEKSNDRFIPAFDLNPNDLELSRLAQQTQYFDKIGRRAGLMGYESGQFEMWVWPWKPLRGFELQFLLGTSTQPILARDIVRTISVTPEVTTLTYTYEAFTVREHIIVPRDEPGAILLLDVHTTQPLSIIPGFLPVMQPMWPAGIGGQFSYWENDVDGYVISEGQWRAIFICGSPGARQMAAPPAHMFGDNPLQFRIDVNPGDTDGKFLPIVIAGSIPDASGKMNMDSTKAVYARLSRNAVKYYEENYRYYQALRRSTIQVITPDKEFNLAYEWGKIALDNLLVANPRLGYGMVAGFGLSGGGARPGFGWFFGGDAFINILTLNSVGMFQQARDALAFTQKWQRQENYPIRKKNPSDPPKDIGKMAHELSQSDGELCDWWNDYHYGYNHADTTPWYIVAMADYVRSSGDTEFLKQSWRSVKQAYAWCLSKDSDGDGLMDLKGAGLGALEFGKLVGIYADVYTCGVWVQGIREMKYMAELVGDSTAGREAEAQVRRAQPQLEKKFWLEKEAFYSYGATEKGEQVHEKTPWSGVAMMFGLLDEARTAKSIEAFNSADLCTDWGVRSLSNQSALFDPMNYNYGAVWPFISSFFNTAQFKHHYAVSGYQTLQSNIKHVFDHALGVVPEVFSGEMNEKLGEGYHHQGFSTTGYMLPLLRGLLGLAVDGVKKTVTVSPHLPQDWGADYISIKNVFTGKDSVDILLKGEWRTQCDLMVGNRGPESVKIIYIPSLSPAIDSVRSVLLRESSHNQEELLTVELFATNQDVHFNTEFDAARGQTRIATSFNKPMFLQFPILRTSVGARNHALKLISQSSMGHKLTLVIEGASGETYRLIHDSSHLVMVEGAIQKDKDILVTFEKKPGQEFVRKEIVITLK